MKNKCIREIIVALLAASVSFLLLGCSQAEIDAYNSYLAQNNVTLTTADVPVVVPTQAPTNPKGNNGKANPSEQAQANANENASFKQDDTTGTVPVYVPTVQPGDSAVSVIPQFIKGDPGPMGPQGPAGPQGERGESGSNGKDGRGIESCTINSDGDLIITYTDGATQNAGKVREENDNQVHDKKGYVLVNWEGTPQIEHVSCYDSSNTYIGNCDFVITNYFVQLYDITDVSEGKEYTYQFNMRYRFENADFDTTSYTSGEIKCTVDLTGDDVTFTLPWDFAVYQNYKAELFTSDKTYYAVASIRSTGNVILK